MIRTLALTAILLAALPAATAHAAPWLDSDLIAFSSDVQDPVVASAPDGTAVAVWVNGGTGRIEAGLGLPDGQFAPLGPISPGGGDASSPDLAIDGDGRATAIWDSSAGLRVAERPAGGSFELAAEPLSDPTISDPDLAVNAAGDAAVVWRDDGSESLEASVRPRNGSFGDPETMATSVNGPFADVQVASPRVAVDGDGNVLALWIRTIVETPLIGDASWSVSVRSAERAAAGTFAITPGASVHSLGGAGDEPDDDIAELSVTANPDGEALAGWLDEYSSARAVGFAARAPGASFGPDEQVDFGGAAPEDRITQPRPTLLPDGRQLLVYDRGGTVMAAARPRGGVVGTPAPIGGSGGGPNTVTGLSLASGPDGTAIAAWHDAPANGIQVAVRRPGEAFGPAESIFDEFADPTETAVSVGPAGRGAALWVAPGASFDAVWGAAYDGAPAATGPAETPAGEAPAAPGTSADSQAPSVGRFSASNRRFAVARAATPLSARLARGTTFRWTLSEPARVSISISRAVPGLRHRGRCRRATARLRRTVRRRVRCTLQVSAGKPIARDGAAGANRAFFSGRLGRRALKPGRYSARLTATDAAGNSTRSPALTFRIVRYQP
jgi:hypothetical protein